jgi:predicted AAA+ superfamily ATPase
MRRFWTMLAHYHAQVLNAADIARSLSVSESSVRRYLDVLSGSYVVRQLQPWHENLKKRQVRSPKVYVRDTGLLHALLSLETQEQLESHPKLGASWEGFAIEEILTLRAARNVYFWATHAGAELDLLVFEGGKRIGFEVKYTDAPRTTRSMRVAIEDLGLERLYVVYPGTESFPLDDRIHALAVTELA